MGNNNDNDNYEWDHAVETGTWTINTEEIEKSIIDSTLLQDENLFIEAARREQGAAGEVSKKLEEVASATDPVDTARIRQKVNQKIIIRSEELRNKKDRKQKKKDKRKAEGDDRAGGAPSPAQSSSEIYGVLHEGPEPGEGRKEASEFRKQASDWRDAPPSNDWKGGRVPILSLVAVILAVIIFITGIQTTSVYADYVGRQKKALAMAELEELVNREYEEVLSEVQEREMPVAATEPEEVVEEPKRLALVLSSVEKDLKIKLVDEDESLVKNVFWSVTVTDDKGNEEEEEDDDEDGVIHLTGISAGDYSVSINPGDSLAGYILPDGIQTCSVKTTVEYKVIANIRDEIKTEKEVNAAEEDANGNKAADVETGNAPADTVEWCESTKTAGGETFVEAAVDLSKTAKLDKKESPLLAFIKDLGSRALLFNRRTIASAAPLILTGATVSGNSAEPSEDGKKEEGSSSEGTSEDNQSSSEGTKDSSSDSSGSSGEKKAKEEASVTLSGYASTAEGTSVTVSATVTPVETIVYWSSSDSSIASVSVSDDSLTATITGVRPGEVTIRAEGDNGKSAELTFTVTGRYADSAQLYDSEKHALYVYENDAYRLAKYEDYLKDSARKFYRKVDEFLYTGWQNIDGVTYYYRSDHTYVTGDQIIQGVTYHFDDNGALSQGSGTLGIDVSKYQPSINWSSVRDSGVSFVIIRCGYRGASTGVLIQDPYYISHIKGAKAAGLKVGIYFFSTALNEAEAVEEASMCAALAGGYGVNYPIFIDVEPSPRAGYNALSVSQRTANITAFCKTIRSAGYSAGVYANKNWFSEKIDTSQLSGCKIWLAQYNAAGPTYSGHYDIWQYTSKGSVNGISGNVDMNQSYLGY